MAIAKPEKWVLRKLPVFGRAAESNFEWPTAETFASLDSDLTVKSIKFMKSPNASYPIGYMSFTMSDGTEAPALSCPETDKLVEEKVINIDAQRPIKQVTGA